MVQRRFYPILILIAFLAISMSPIVFADDDGKSGTGGRCKQVNANIETTLTGPDSATCVVTRDRLIKGTCTIAIYVDSFAPVAGGLPFSADVMATTKRGTYTLKDAGLFEPWPGGLFTEYAKMVEGTGTGIFENATGLLFLNGALKLDGSGVMGNLRGEICLAKRGRKNRDDND